MTTKKGESVPTKDTRGSAPLGEEEEEVASVTTTTQGTPYAIKYERVVEEDEEYNELQIEEDDLISNDGSLFEEDLQNEEAIGDFSAEVSNAGEVDRTEQKKVIKLQTINVRGLQNGGKKPRTNKFPEVEDDEEDRVHVVKREVDSDEEYVYPPKKRSKITASPSLRKKRRAVRVGRGGPSPSTTSEKETKLNVVRRAEESLKPRRILLRSSGGASKTSHPSSCRNAGVQCNIPRLDPIREGILAEMSLINDLFKLEVQEMLSRPRLRRNRRSATVHLTPSSWHQSERHHASKRGVVDMLRVVKKEITEDDTVEIIVCDNLCV